MDMDKYKYLPEILLAAMDLVRNCCLILACAWTIVTLYKLSGSWHSLWPLLMLCLLTKEKFIRD
jgi:hypothetical protein